MLSNFVKFSRLLFRLKLFVVPFLFHRIVSYHPIVLFVIALFHGMVVPRVVLFDVQRCPLF